jgi:hypothetical protein
VKNFKTIFTNLFVIIFFGVAFTPIQAQMKRSKLPSMVWDKIPPEDLDLTQWAADTTAPAVVLGHTGKLVFTEVRNNYWGYIFKEHRRVKVFKKPVDGLDTVVFRYYPRYAHSYVTKIKAHTILPNGARYTVNPVHITDKKIDKHVSEVKFGFPAVAEGAILEHEIEYESSNVMHLRSWSFQSNIPTRFSHIDLDINSRVTYSYMIQNPNLVKQSEIEKEYTSFGIDKLLSRIKYAFYAQDLPAFKKLNFISSIDNYKAEVKFQAIEMSFQNIEARFKEGEEWADVLKNERLEEETGSMYRSKTTYSDVWEKAEKQINPRDPANVKVQKLYDWVNKSFKLKNYDSWISRKTPDQVLEAKNGSSEELNLMLIALMREAGLNAHPVFSSTHENGYVLENYASMRQFNYILASVEIDGKTVLLDCGNPYRPIGSIAPQARNSKGLVLTDSTHSWINLAQPILVEKLIQANLEIKQDSLLVGETTFQYKGDWANEIRAKALEKKDSTKAFSAYLKSELPNWSTDSLVFKNLTMRSGAFNVRAQVNIEGAAKVEGDLISLTPNLNSRWLTNPFPETTRLFPVDFFNPIAEQFVVNIKIPEGYKVVEMPPSLNTALPNGDIRFQYLISEQMGAISLRMKLDINKTYYTVESYAQVKSLFESISNTLSAKILLKKISK